MEGVNSSRVSLAWEFTASSSHYFVSIGRQRPGDTNATLIASRTESQGFVYANQSLSKKYEPKLPATLVLNDVKQNEEFVYAILVLDGRGAQKLSDNVTIDVFGK